MLQVKSVDFSFLEGYQQVSPPLDIPEGRLGGKKEGCGGVLIVLG